MLQAEEKAKALAKLCSNKLLNWRESKKVFDAFYYAEALYKERGNVSDAAKRAGVCREHLGKHVTLFTKEGLTHHEKNKQRNEQKQYRTSNNRNDT